MKGDPRRGAALPETALVLTIILAMLVGAMRMALIGFEQASVDGAAFYNSHQNAIKGTDPSVATNLDPTMATHTAFPRSSSQTIASPVPLPAPTSQDASVLNNDYGFDQSGNRHGGTSLIQPMQTYVTVQRTGLASLLLFDGGSVTVSGIGVDPMFQETGVHGDISGNNFGTSASYTGASDYFTQGENTPPYFGGFHYLRWCADADSPSWNQCSTTEFRALGMAEYLDVDNWTRSPNGIAPLQQAVFWETLYHQQTYAALSAVLSRTDLQSANDQLTAQAALNPSVNAALCTVYSWDSTQQGGFPAPGYQPGQYPLNPGGVCGS